LLKGLRATRAFGSLAFLGFGGADADMSCVPHFAKSVRDVKTLKSLRMPSMRKVRHFVLALKNEM
jgi:hypothetical protein